MSRFITPPDTDFASKNPSVLIIGAADSEVEVLGLMVKQIDLNVDIYLYRDEFDDTGWAFTVAGAVDKVFRFPASTLQDVTDYLQKLNG